MWVSSLQATRNKLSLPKKPAVGGRPVRLNKHTARSRAIMGWSAAQAAEVVIGSQGLFFAAAGCK